VYGNDDGRQEPLQQSKTERHISLPSSVILSLLSRSLNFSLLLLMLARMRRMVLQSRGVISLSLLGLLVVLGLSHCNPVIAASQDNDTDSHHHPQRLSVEACRTLGFDPWQLSCETCRLLNVSSSSSSSLLLDQCHACCQSYKTLEKRTRAYGGAIVLHSNIPRAFPEIDSFLEEDLKSIIWTKKGKDRVVVTTMPGLGGGGQRGGGMMMGMGMGSMYGPPSAILWFDDLPPTNDMGISISELQQRAKEIIILEGWKRDDIRDMLLSLLPDLPQQKVLPVSSSSSS
jgi:hypothetical protein